jgi:DNA-binding IclR family transcriptional regulator
MPNGKQAQKILDCLKKAAPGPRDLSIEEIAAETGIHRNTISKYVYGLEKEGKIVMTRQVGAAKLYTIKDGKG